MLFRRRQKRYEAEKTGQKLLELCEKPVKYVVLRDPAQHEETVIGKNGYINCSDGRIIISCEGKVVFDMPLEEISLGELMSKNGATFSYIDKKTNKKLTVIAYYSYYRK
jgi:hypothetical protein